MRQKATSVCEGLAEPGDPPLVKDLTPCPTTGMPAADPRHKQKPVQRREKQNRTWNRTPRLTRLRAETKWVGLGMQNRAGHKRYMTTSQESLNTVNSPEIRLRRVWGQAAQHAPRTPLGNKAAKKIKGIKSLQSADLLRSPFLSHRPVACHCFPNNYGEKHTESALSAPGCRVLHRGCAPRVIERDRNALPTNLGADFLATEFFAHKYNKKKTDEEEWSWIGSSLHVINVFIKPTNEGGDVTARVCFAPNSPKSYEQLSIAFSGNVDQGPRKR